MEDIKIVLAGNPNAGKTTLFNTLTGARQTVGNYPGVTVDKKEGKCLYDGKKIIITDLPGTYSLSAYSLEEIVARDFLIDEKPDMVINIVDSSNLERNLYLTVQFLELGIPVCIALSMLDIAKQRGIEIDILELSKKMQVPVIPIDGRSGRGKKNLLKICIEKAEAKQKITPLKISYSSDINKALIEIEEIIKKENFLLESYNPAWVALKYIENDELIISKGNIANINISKNLKTEVTKLSKHTKATLDSYPEAIIADWRYGFIHSIVSQGVVKRKEEINKLYISDKIDRVVTNRLAGPFIMAAILMFLYSFTFSYSEIPTGWVESFFGFISQIAETHLPDGHIKSLLISGIIDGVGGVLGFTPIILFMFFGIAILEDSGYLARVAFMMDRVFRLFGMHGNSVMAYIISGGIAGGCAVPGIMATRTLRSPKERLATILTAPFMNCGAKLPVMALMIAAFFSNEKAKYMLIFTVIAWTTALLTSKILRLTIIRGESTPFVMELPPYRIPTLKGLLIHTWERTWQYIKKAGTVILVISIMIWAMMTFPKIPISKTKIFEIKRNIISQNFNAKIIKEVKTAKEGTKLSEKAQEFQNEIKQIDKKEAEAALRHSIAGKIGTFFEPITQMAGFDWRTNIALLGGFAAKEVIVSTLGTAYSLGNVDTEKHEELVDKLASEKGWNKVKAFALTIFIMFYAPCFVAVICIAKESSWKWAIFSIIFNTTLAFTLAVSAYQIGSIFCKI